MLKDKRNQVYERNLLILLATDGIPTDERERTDIQTLEHVLRNERQPIDRIPVTIIVCTGRLQTIGNMAIVIWSILADDDQSMAYLNDWDKRIPNLDVVDDYRSERQQIQTCRGKNTPFSFGDVGCTIPLFVIVSSSLCLVHR